MYRKSRIDIIPLEYPIYLEGSTTVTDTFISFVFQASARIASFYSCTLRGNIFISLNRTLYTMVCRKRMWII